MGWGGDPGTLTRPDRSFDSGGLGPSNRLQGAEEHAVGGQVAWGELMDIDQEPRRVNGGESERERIRVRVRVSIEEGAHR